MLVVTCLIQFVEERQIVNRIMNDENPLCWYVPNKAGVMYPTTINKVNIDNCHVVV
jgi:hypothetical protein